ncbi:MAG: peptide deformylase [Parcubacteria group bacterium]|nr:peptide deformylase [Parcubacteria group bacterium]
MTSRPVLTDPNDELRKISEKVSDKEIGTKELDTLIDDLIETMEIENGIGIAAPQIGVHKRIIIIDTGDGPQALINPEVTARSLRKVESEEGCLSVPGVYGMVKRHREIKARALDRHGNEMKFRAKGLLSIVFQHEVDHLDGVLFIDKVFEYTKPPKLEL